MSVQSLQPSNNSNTSNNSPTTNTATANERLVKAKSDGSISSSNPTTDNSAVLSLSKLKSKSLEPLTGTEHYLGTSDSDILLI